MDSHLCEDLFDEWGALCADARSGRVEGDNARLIHEFLF
jgi:hypothetical protein